MVVTDNARSGDASGRYRVLRNIAFFLAVVALSIQPTVASDFLIYAIVGVALLALASIVLTVVFKPQPVIQVFVRCGDVVETCVEAVERAIKRRRP